MYYQTFFFWGGGGGSVLKLGFKVVSGFRIYGSGFSSFIGVEEGLDVLEGWLQVQLTPEMNLLTSSR